MSKSKHSLAQLAKIAMENKRNMLIANKSRSANPHWKAEAYERSRGTMPPSGRGTTPPGGGHGRRLPPKPPPPLFRGGIHPKLNRSAQV